jgi:hypothetical protein
MTQEAKIDKIFEMVHAQNIDLQKVLVQHEQHRKELDIHTLDLKTLNEYRNQNIGKTTVLSVVFAAIGSGLVALIKHFS